MIDYRHAWNAIKELLLVVASFVVLALVTVVSAFLGQCAG